MEQNRQELNTSMPAYSKISAVEIIEGGFEHTPKQSIKRFLYSLTITNKIDSNYYCSI